MQVLNPIAKREARESCTEDQVAAIEGYRELRMSILGTEDGVLLYSLNYGHL